MLCPRPQPVSANSMGVLLRQFRAYLSACKTGYVPEVKYVQRVANRPHANTNAFARNECIAQENARGLSRNEQERRTPGCSGRSKIQEWRTARKGEIAQKREHTSQKVGTEEGPRGAKSAVGRPITPGHGRHCGRTDYLASQKFTWMDTGTTPCEELEGGILGVLGGGRRNQAGRCPKLPKCHRPLQTMATSNLKFIRDQSADHTLVQGSGAEMLDIPLNQAGIPTGFHLKNPLEL
ncbi:hypothetical protein B0H13DRAFT_1919109 [Mycena leptocephala]|nr:hypothetical protein B0H13DRAFT_1919109 [Mycena leptocephala]